MSHEQSSLVVFLTALAALLYAGYDYWRQRSKKQTREIDFKDKTDVAKVEAETAHDEAKKQGPEALSDDTDRMLGL